MLQSFHAAFDSRKLDTILQSMLRAGEASCSLQSVSVSVILDVYEEPDVPSGPS